MQSTIFLCSDNLFFSQSFTNMVLQGDSDSSIDDGSDLIMPKETLESDQELKMHLLGMDSFWTQSLAETRVITADLPKKFPHPQVFLGIWKIWFGLIGKPGLAPLPGVIS